MKGEGGDTETTGLDKTLGRLIRNKASLLTLSA